MVHKISKCHVEAIMLHISSSGYLCLIMFGYCMGQAQAYSHAPLFGGFAHWIGARSSVSVSALQARIYLAASWVGERAYSSCGDMGYCSLYITKNLGQERQICCIIMRSRLSKQFVLSRNKNTLLIKFRNKDLPPTNLEKSFPYPEFVCKRGDLLDAWVRPSHCKIILTYADMMISVIGMCVQIWRFSIGVQGRLLSTWFQVR